METSNIVLAYFSATYTTKKVVKKVAEHFAVNIAEYDITQIKPKKDICIGSDDLLIVGVPVYAGRVPAIAADALDRFKGSDTPAVIVCVYGNRDYDDALLELKDMVEGNGFKVISAAAFIAQHAIFPQAGWHRPDEKDMVEIKDFASKSIALLKSVTDISSLPQINVKGNKPYKIPKKIPLQPKGDKKCNECGTCVKLCPVQAIHSDTPRKTDKTKCIACGRCIVVCPQHARHFSGLIYKVAGKKFIKSYSARKEPDMTFA